MEASRPAIGVRRVLASVEEVWASAVGPWFSILSVQSVLYGLLAAALGGILFMKLGKKVRVPQDQRKVNDHIYELYKPKGDLQPAMEILFFHGLQFGPSQHAYLSTWTSPGDGSTCEHVWPGTWLAEEFPNARILSMSYDSSMRRTPEQGRSDLFNVAENLIHAICLANIGQEFRRPVILVGHSFGGLVIKKLCIEAHRSHSQRPDLKTNQMIKEFLHNVGGVFFYGTPHRGSALGSMACRVLDGPLLAYVRRLDTDSARLHEDFCDVRSNYKTWRVAGVGELLATRRGPFHDVVVPEACARYGEFSTVQEDHISLCKPGAKTSNNFQRLTNFIGSIVPKEGAYFENRQRTPKAAVGLDFLVEDVHGKLEANSTLGMVGMGGVGKTTLAKAVFNNLSPQFEYSCFVPEVKLIARRVEETLIKKELWKRMHCRGKMVADPDREEWSQLKGKKLLLVLDDVAEDCDLQILSDIKEDVDSGSRFIVTSRNRVLLTSFRDDIYVYPVQGLTKANAKELFVSYAFPEQAVIPVAFESLVDRIVEKCDGLPLTLEVLGNYLKRSKEDKTWEQSLEALDKADNVAGLDQKLWAKLRISYDGLCTEEQQMFLDVTTFFSVHTGRFGWTLREAKAAWGVAYGYEDLRWRSLVDMSLVYDGDQYEPIKVHEQLRSLGRKIASDANQDGKCIRVWERAERLKLLQSADRSSNQEFHSLRLRTPEDGQVTIPRSCLRTFKKLQFLDVYHNFGDWGTLTLDGAEENVTVPTDLVLLQSPDLQFAQVYLDPALLRRLAVLKLSNYDLTYLPNSIGLLSALKIFHIRAQKLEILPETFGHLLSLEWLKLNCHLLQTLPVTFGHLSNLKHLQIDGYHLRTLPNSFGRLSKLQYLHLEAGKLQSLPDSFEGLSSLEHLNFYKCYYLNVLPESFIRLPTLKQLEFHFCLHLQCLPESFGQLRVLENLKFMNCRSLQSLPESFVRLPALKKLEFWECDRLQFLPESFGQLPVLKHLEINCRNLQYLPESFGQLPVLKHLQLICPNLQSLPESFGQLTTLQNLIFSNTSGLQSLPESFGQLSTLELLNFLHCDDLHTLPDCQFPNLVELIIFNCRKIESLAFFPGQLKALQRLAIHYTALGKIPDWIKSLPLLQILELGGLPYLEGWPPWLDVDSLDPAITSWQFFRTQDGQFGSLNSEDLRKKWSIQVEEWLHGNAMDKMTALDYDGAVADLQRVLRVLGPDDWRRRRCILQERGIVKRYIGDFDGALEDLTLALNMCNHSDDRGDGGDSDGGDDYYMYNCRKHMGYVKYLLGDVEGAREDGKEALKHLRESYEKETLPSLLSLGDDPISYLEFKFTGFTEGKELIELSILQAMEKLRASDFHGALAEFERASDFHGVMAEFEPVEATLPGLRDQFILQERGICKRLVGDLDGALEDLTAALELDWEEDKDHYECRKHRGFVKYLLGDLDGAREDANKARAIGRKTTYKREWSDEWEIGQRSCLGVDPIKFLEFKLE